MNAFLSGLELAKANGHNLADIHSVASFFVSRVDLEIDNRLDAIGTDEAAALKGKAGLANARLAYQAFEEVFSSERWALLADAGALPQRPLWASTGVKNPAYPDTLYVTELVAAHVVNTMPEKTLDATFDHGVVTGDTITGTYEEVQRPAEPARGPGHLLQRRCGRPGDRRPGQVRRQLEGPPEPRPGSPGRCRRGRLNTMTSLAFAATGAAQEAGAAQLLTLVADQVASRIFAKDATLWGPDAEAESAIRLGWVEAAEVSAPLVAEITALRAELRAEGINHIVLVRHGRLLTGPRGHHGHRRRGTDVSWTAPTPTRCVPPSATAWPRRPLWFPPSRAPPWKPTRSDASSSRSSTAAGIDAKSRIIIVTDPGSPLDGFAREAGYRKVFNADPNVGGRYSGLTAFGLVPSGLAGADIAALLDSAEEAGEMLRDDDVDNVGLRLGAALGGTSPLRNKIVIVEDGSGIVGFADWAEQLIAESTGKLGTGVLPVVADANSPEVTQRRRRCSGGAPGSRGLRRRTS